MKLDSFFFKICLNMFSKLRVYSFKYLGGSVNHCAFQPQFMKVFHHFQTNKAGSYYCCCFWIVAFNIRINPIHIRDRSEEHTSELQSRGHLVCRLLLEKKKKTNNTKR